MGTRLKQIAPIFVSVAMIFFIAVGIIRGIQLDRARTNLAASVLRGDSLQAEADTTRLVVVPGLAEMYERRAVQLVKVQDSLGDALDRSVAARTRLEVTLVTVQRQVTGTPVEVVTLDDSLKVRLASFEVHQPPVHAYVDVELPPPGPVLPMMRLNLQFDPIPISTRIFCEPGPDLNVAKVGFTVPDFLTLQLTEVHQARDVCNAPPLRVPMTTKIGYGSLGFAAGMVTTIIGVLALIL